MHSRLPEAKEVLAGERILPLHGGEAKCLFTMLVSPSGADWLITEAETVVRYGGGSWQHDTPCGAASLAWLLAWAGVTGPVTVVRAYLPGERVVFPLAEGTYRAMHRYDDRLLWVRAGTDRIEINLRPPEQVPDGLAADPPPFVEPPPLLPVFVDLCTAVACPHCARRGTRYRQLRDDGRFVCPHCGGSFPPPAP